MSSEIEQHSLEAMEAEVRSSPSTIDLEMACQPRVVVGRIIAIKPHGQLSKPCIHVREAGLHLLDALERL
jgi:hypothetical protein